MDLSSGIIRVRMLAGVLIVALLLSLPAVVAARTSASPVNEDSPSLCTIEQSCSALMFCGDGFCDAYTGENAGSCAADCAPAIATLTATITPTATLIPTTTPTETVTPTGSVTTTTTPSTATIGPLTGTAAAQATSTAEAAMLAQGCGLTAYESRTTQWQSAYARTAGDFVPVENLDREVFVCQAPPTGEVCVPISSGLLDAANSNADKIKLVDCSGSGSCSVYGKTLHRVGDMMCATVTVSDAMSCAEGCALAVEQGGSLFPRIPFLDFIPIELAVPIASIGVILAVLGIGVMIFSVRRSRQKELPGSGGKPARAD